jgi:hypothetical protein
MLDPPAPGISGQHGALANDEPEQKGLDTPIAHDRIS